MPIRTFATEVLTSSNVNTYLMNQASIICTSGTRPGSPVSGMHIWQTDTLTEYVWDGSAWQFLRGIQQFAQKSADETVSTTSLQDDDHLFVSVAANSIYLVQLFLLTNSGLDDDFSSPSFSGPSGFTVTGSQAHMPPNNQTDKDTSRVNTAGFTAGMAGYGSDALMVIADMIVTTSATAGTLKYRWARGALVASNAIIRAGSYMYAEKIA